MNDANGFRNTNDPAAYDACERCINQLIASIKQLVHVWKVFWLKLYLINFWTKGLNYHTTIK